MCVSLGLVSSLRLPPPIEGPSVSVAKSEKLNGRQWFLVCVSYSFGGRFLGMLSRCLALVLSTSLEAVRRLLAMWLEVCKLGMCSNSAPGTL